MLPLHWFKVPVNAVELFFLIPIFLYHIAKLKKGYPFNADKAKQGPFYQYLMRIIELKPWVICQPFHR